MRVFRSIPARADHPIALTIGNFDGVHLGHQAMLERLRREAAARGLPAAVMTFEPHPREFFAPDQAPARLSSLREKLEILAALGVDRAHVCRFSYDLARTPPAPWHGPTIPRPPPAPRERSSRCSPTRTPRCDASLRARWAR